MKRMVFSLIFFYNFGLLPAQQTVGLFLNDSLAQNGYTLFAPNRNTYLIDNCGFLINSWQSTSTPGLSAYLIPDGRLLRTGSIVGDLMGSGSGGRLEIFDWEGNIEWSYDYSSSNYLQHHDIEPLPNGNILVLAWEVIAQDSAIAAGRNANVTNKNVWPEKIVELQPIGNDSATVVWEWHAWDHLIQDQDSAKANFGVVADHPELIDINFAAVNGVNNPGVTGIDWLHANAIFYNKERDEILLSSRNFSEVWIIDHSTTTEEAKSNSGGNSDKGGDLLYRWGNPQAYDRGTSQDQKFYQQHDPQWIPTGYPDAGKIMVFNNGNNRPGGLYSSVDFIEPELDANGKYLPPTNQGFDPIDLSRTIDSYQSERFTSSIMSGAHPLPNGNVLICDANDGHFFEIAPNGELVWDYFNPVSFNGPVSQGSTVPFQAVFRATKYTDDFIGFDNLDLIPGDPIELNPLPSECVIHGGMISDLSFPFILNKVTFQSNQVVSAITFEHSLALPIQVELFDLLGRRLFQQSFQEQRVSIDIEGWLSGMYLIRIRENAANKSGVWKILKY